jgi:ribosomal protein L44E
MNRKQRRAAQKLARKNKNTDLEEKLSLHDRLSESCRVCERDFDKKDMKMVSEWMVVVRENEKSVNLYCPSCWDNAKKIISEIKESEIK